MHVELDAVPACSVRQVAVGLGARGGPLEENEGIALAMYQAMITWLRTANLNDLELAIVGDDPIEILQELTSDRALLMAGIQAGLNPLRETLFDDVLEHQRDALEHGRSGSVAKPDQGLLVLGDAIAPTRSRRSFVQRDLALAEGIEIYVVGIPAGPILDIPLDPQHFFDYSAPNINAKAARAATLALETVERSAAARRFVTLTITSTVPSAFDYVPNSAAPPAKWDPGARTLAWTFSRPPSEVNVEYDVIPRECGATWEVPDTSWATGVDSEGNVHRHDYVHSQVDVPCPTATPSATPVTPASTAVASLTPQPSPTRRPKPGVLYLPLTLYELPCSVQRRAAVALVVDTSLSMLEPSGPGRTKLDAAVDAAASFIDVLQFPQDQAAVIGFNSTVETHELSSDRTTLRAQLGALNSQPGTDIAAGVVAAHRELMSPRRRLENFPALVILTDGQASDGPTPGVVAAAAAKADGVIIFTVGLGATVDEEQLRAMASRPEWFYAAATAEDLKSAYEAVAIDLPCPASRYWGRR